MPSFVSLFAHTFHLALNVCPEVLLGSCNCRKLELDNCMFTKLAPNFSSLRNLETLTLRNPIQDLTSLQDLDRLTQLTIDLRHRCNATLTLLCPSNLLQLEISNHSFSAYDRLAIDKVCCHVMPRFVAMTRPT